MVQNPRISSKETWTEEGKGLVSGEFLPGAQSKVN